MLKKTMRLIENGNDNHSHLALQEFFILFNYFLLLRNKAPAQIKKSAHS